MEIKVSGDEVYEVEDSLKKFMEVPELYGRIMAIREMIGIRLEYGEILESEANFLKKIKRELYIPALDEE